MVLLRIGVEMSKGNAMAKFQGYNVDEGLAVILE